MTDSNRAATAEEYNELVRAHAVRKNKKWKLVKWRLAIEILVILGAVGIAFATKAEQPAVAFMIVAFADLTANYATYFSTNVIQKNIISKNYRPELDDGGH